MDDKFLIKDIVAEICAIADELKSGKQTETTFWQLFAYCSVLGIIKSAYAGYDLDDIGLNFDIDAKYLLKNTN